MDKNEIMIEYLQDCPIIQHNPLYFNFGNIENNAHQVITSADDKSLSQPYIDGSVSKRYTFHIDCFKSVAYNTVVQGYQDENIFDISEVQGIMDWINDQGENRVFPNFGEGYIVDNMSTTTNSPDLISVEDNTTPPIAVYRISIEIDYMDNTKRIWN